MIQYQSSTSTYTGMGPSVSIFFLIPPFPTTRVSDCDVGRQEEHIYLYMLQIPVRPTDRKEKKEKGEEKEREAGEEIMAQYRQVKDG